MGAIFDEARVRCDRASLEGLYYELVSQRGWEAGHGGYSGTFVEAEGLLVSDLRFSSWEVARAYVDAEAEKWGPAVAVRVVVKGETPGWFIGAWCSS